MDQRSWIDTQLACGVPLQNRVSPIGAIEVASARGLFMGNRGRLHDGEKRIVRGPTTRSWVTCTLEYKGKRRTLMSPDRYTELFFLDEAVALAAGHRPCARCRYNDFRAYLAAASAGMNSEELRSADIDSILNSERKGRATPVPPTDLPDGCLVELVDQDGYWLVMGDAIHRWTHAGYDTVRPRREMGTSVSVLTPHLTVGALCNGYAPVTHSSAT